MNPPRSAFGAPDGPAKPDARRPLVWSIAGSDSGGGAGLQADLKAFEAFDVHGCTAVATVTAQSSTAVERIEAVSPSMLEAQLAALAGDMPPAAIKTGLLGSADNVRVVAQWVDRLRAAQPDLALVVDPVLRATTGASFASDEVLRAYRQELLPRATLITPNGREAEALLGRRMDAAQAARALVEAGAGAAVVTGGDEAGTTARDFAHTPQATGWLELPRIDTPHHHGTGCVFASSAAAALALGFVEADALVVAKMSTAAALRQGYAAGRGAGPVRPAAGFASALENLPCWSSTAAAQPFAPLTRPHHLGLYAIVDNADWLERVLAAGARTVQLRIKDVGHPRLADEIRRGVQAARAAEAQLFINDHWALAIEHGAYGVHLGQEDLATADLDALRAAGVRLGISTHSYWEVCRAWALKPSYIACGPIHATQLKRMPWTPQGDDNLAYWCALLQPATPVVAIGGMDEQRTQEAARCGAAGVAVVSAITGAAQPEAAIAALQAAIVLGRSLPARTAPALAKPTLSRR